MKLQLRALQGVRKIACAVLLSSLVISSGASLSQTAAASNEELDGQQMLPLSQGVKDGSHFLGDLEKKFSGLDCYSFESEAVTRKGKKEEVAVGKVIVKQSGGLVRVEVGGAGSKAGSVVVKKKDGSVRFKGGPHLFGLCMNLDPDSRMLKLANGINVLETDFLSLTSRLHQISPQANKYVVTDAPVVFGESGEKVFVLDVVSKDELKERILVSPATMFPVQWDMFVGGKLYSSVRFKNVKKTVEVTDDVFNV